MGMFDYVAFDGKCPQCGADLEGWQTKSTPDPCMNTVTPDKTSNFYTSCEKCGAWVEANIEPPKEMRIILLAYPKDEQWWQADAKVSGRKVYTIKTVTQEVKEVE